MDSEERFQEFFPWLVQLLTYLNCPDAENGAAEVILRAIEYDRKEKIQSPIAFLRTTARNFASEQRRKVSKRERPITEDTPVPSVAPNYDLKLDTEARMKRLSSKDRGILRSYLESGRRGVAETFEITQAAADGRIHKIKKKLEERPRELGKNLRG
jgi:DNA-directed RNA polymerase specialized sigma24 family protein